MGRGRARKVALAIAAAVLLAATAVLVASAAPSARPLKYACASDLYNAKDVLHYVARPSQCAGSGKTLVNFTKPGLVYTCRKKHGTPHGTVPKIARSKRGIRPYGPAGLMRKVSKLSDCKPPSQPNEAPVTLPAKARTYYCSAKRGGELRSVKKPKQCDRKEFPVVLRKRTAGDSAGGNPGGPGEITANPDTGTTDENATVSIGVLANDTAPAGRSLTIASTDTTGTAGTLAVNAGATSITYNPNGKFESLKPGQTATDTFRYRATDGPDTSAPATVTVTITGANDAPVANDDSARTNEDHATSFTVLGNDTDVDGDPLHVGSLDLIGTQGLVAVAGDNSVSYDPNAKFDSLQVGQTATDSFKYRANDGSADSNPATVTVTIDGRNDAPVLSGVESTKLDYFEGSAAAPVSPGIAVADPDNANVHGATVTIASGLDSAHDTLEFTNQNGIAGSFASGTLTLTGDASKADYQAALRSVGFRSTGGASGDRSVTFRVDDGSAASNLSNVVSRTVTVDQAPHAVDDTKTVDEDSGATTIDVRANDTDSDGGPKKITGKSGGSHGTVAITNSGDDLTYTPAADYCGPDSFTYTLNGGSQATVSITVTCEDDPPVAVADSATVAEDSGATAVDVLSNDTDVDGGTKEITATTDGAHGAVTGTGGTAGHRTGLTYQPNANYCGSDSFTYTLNGGSQATVSMTVTCVNDAPVVDLNGSAAGSDTTASFTEDSPAASVAPVADVSDVDSANLSSATITLANHPDGNLESLGVATTGTAITATAYNSGTGVLALSGSDTVAHYQQVLRTLKYQDTSDTPNTTDRSVTVKVNDGALDSNTATSTVSVTAHNDAPHATDQTGAGAVSGTEDTSSNITLAGTDPEGDTLTFTYDSPSAHGGTITGMGSSVTYTPVADFCGADSFTFHVSDGNGGSDDGTVEINVACMNDAPVVTVSSGSASYTEGGSPVPFDPNVTISDVDDTNLSSAVVAIGNNFTPADGDTLSMSPNPQNGITATYNSPGPGFLTLSGTSSIANYQAALRTVAFSLTSDNPSGATRGIQVQVVDPHGSASVTQGRDMTVTPTNDAPAADNQSTSVSEDGTKGITLTGSDPENDPLTFASDQPSHGSVTPTNNSSVTYTPDADYCGPDSFTFHTNDGTVDSSNGTVSITVNCVNDAPVLDLNGPGAGSDDTTSFTEDAGAVQLAANATVTDVDNANLSSATVTLTNRPDGTAESLLVTTAGTSITADAYDNSTGQLSLHGSDTKAHYQQVLRSVAYNNSSDNPDTADRNVDFTVNDGALDSNTPHVTVSVARSNDAPTADGQSLSTDEDTALPITLSGSDVDGDSLTYSSDQPSHGTVSPSTGTSVNYTPDADYCGPDSFTFHTNDGTVNSANGTISITVNCVNDAPVVDLNGPAAGTGTHPSFAEQIAHTGGATTLAPNGTVSDVDDDNLESLTVTLTNHPDGASEFLTADTTGTSITADTYDSGTGVLLLHGTDTKAHYEQVLQTVGYENDAAPPNSTDRTINFVANDGDLDSNTAVSTVSVVPLNAPPVVQLNPPLVDNTSSFTEDSGPAVLAPVADVTDADDPDLASATITLTNRPDGGAESLSVNVSGTSITADAYVPATGVLFLHGADTVADYQQVLRTVAYDNSSDTPDTTNRSVTFSVNDGQDDSPAATDTVSVTAHNDAPTATDQNVSTNEDTGKMITLSGTDPENDPLTFTSDSTSAQGGTITGMGAGVTYTPAQDYCGPDSFNFTVDDGNGGTDTGTVSITVACVNDAPVVDLNGAGTAGIDNSAAFTEDQPAVTLATTTDASDVDNANLVSATVVLTNHPDGAAEGLTAVTTGTSITADAYDSGTGVLFLHGSDTLAHYQQVLRSVAYNNTSDTPDATNRDITWKVNDGSLDSATAHTTLSVTPANDPPALDLNGAPAGTNATAGYTEDQPATTLTPNALASDPDNANLQSATITLTNHPDGAAESLSVDTSGTSITAVAYNSGTGVLSLSGSDTVAHYQQVLRTIAYLNTSQNANTTNRVVNYVANDGSNDSNSPTATVTITVVNDPPVVDMNGGGGGIDSGPVSFVEDSSPTNVGSGPVNLGSSATVSDVDNSQLASATLTLTNHPDGANESLSVNVAGTSITTGGYNSSTGVLTLTGPDTTAHFQQVIQSAQYNNVSNTPDPTDRDITTKVNDGAANSTVAHTTLTVTPTNDAPTAGADTFNSTNSAIGNTTLNVNDTATTGAGSGDGRPPTPDPTDTSPTTDRPHKEITGNIFANDTDPDDASSSFTATPGTFATNDGGTVTIQSDGDFNFEPAPSTSCTDHSDFFNYTVNDNDSSGNATSTGTVTVAITGCVWYVNNNDAQGNSGTSEKPFDTTAQAQTASGNGDTTFVYDGDDTTTGYNTGYTMNTGESLISEGATLTIGSDTLHTADAANKASLTNNNADVVTLAGGASVKSFNIDPQGTGGGIFGTGLGATTVTLDDLNVVDNGTKGTQPGLELDTSAGTTTNVSNLTVNNGDASSATTGDEGVKLNNAGTVNFAAAGVNQIITNGAAGFDAANTNLGTASVLDGIIVLNSGAGGVSLTNTTGSNTSFGDGAGTDLSLTTTSGATPAFNVQTAGSFSIPAAGAADASATGGPAVDVTGSSGSTMPWDSVNSTNSTTKGINLSGLGNGTFSTPAGTIAGAAGTAFAISGGSGAITLGTFTPTTNYFAINNGAGDSASISNRTGGVISMIANVADNNDAGGGVTETSNSGGSVVFAGSSKTFSTGASDAITVSNPDSSTFTSSWAGGGTAITTTSGTGVNVTGVGPTADGTLQFSGTGNTIDSGSGRAFNMTDVNSNSTGMTFDHISSNGATNGIRMNNVSGATAGQGVLFVTGTGSAGTGGTIQSSTGAGIDLTGVTDTNATGYAFQGDRMSITGGGDDGIRATSVGTSAGGGVKLSNSTVSNNGDAAGESGLDGSNLIGNVSLSTDTFSSDYDTGVHISNDSGTLNANVQGGTIQNIKGSGGAGDGIQVQGTNTGAQNLTVNGATFSDNKDSHVQSTSDSSNTTGTNTVNITNNTMSEPSGGGTDLGGGITVNHGGNSVTHTTITGNNIQWSVIGAIAIDTTGSVSDPQQAQIDATIQNNIIGTSGQAGSGSTQGNGIFVSSNGQGHVKTLITGNTVKQWTNRNGLELDVLDGAAQLDATVRANTFSEPNSAFAGTTTRGFTFQLGAAQAGDNIHACLDIGGAGALANQVFGDGESPQPDIRWLYEGPSSGGTSAVTLAGYGGPSNPAITDIASYLQPRNNVGGTPSVSGTAVPTGTHSVTSVASCPQPSP